MKDIDETLEFYREINEGRFESKRAKEYRESVRNLLIRNQNRLIREKVKENIPKLVYTTRAVHQMTFAAREVSRKFGMPTELIGILGGKQIKGNVFFTSYHLFQNQVCNSVNTKADSIGRINTYRDLRQKKVNWFDVAHSHNRMGVFHSSLDDKLLEIETNITDNGFFIDVLGRRVCVRYSNSTVFNERGEVFVKGGIIIPTFDECGITKKYKTYSPEFRVVPYGRIDEVEKRRLKGEIDCFVQYRDVINNQGFIGEF